MKVDLKAFLRDNGSIMPNGRAIARVFHGLSSPAFSVTDWISNKFWGRHKEVDFNDLMKLATEELISFKQANRSQKSEQ